MPLNTIVSSQPAESTAAWSSATSVNTTLQVNCAGYSTVVVTLNQGTTITGGVVTFEFSDTTAFTNAYTGYYQRSAQSGSTGNAYTLTASSNVFFVFNVAGYAAFRVRLSTAISGTATVNVGITLSSGTNLGSVQVLSASNQSAAVDNIASLSYLTGANGTTNPLYVGNAAYGGAFSGTPSASLQGWSKVRQPTVFKTIKAVSVTSGTPVSIWTPGTGNKFRLLGWFLSLSVAGSILFEDTTGSANEFMRTPLMAAGIGMASPNFGGFGYLSAAANNGLFIDVTSTGSVSGIVFGTEE